MRPALFQAAQRVSHGMSRSLLLRSSKARSDKWLTQAWIRWPCGTRFFSRPSRMEVRNVYTLTKGAKPLADTFESQQAIRLAKELALSERSEVCVWDSEGNLVGVTLPIGEFVSAVLIAEVFEADTWPGDERKTR
jgi:hypothetical protein